MVYQNSILLCEKIGRVALLKLNRPEQLNALNDALMDALGQALIHLDRDEEVSVIVLTGTDKAFAAGADIQAMTDWTYQDVFQSSFITRNWETIRSIRKPVIAAVSGFAMGGGCELALSCDVIIASQSAKFALPEIKLAMMPGAGGTQRLPRAIGKAKAMDMCLTARTLSSEEADRYGLVSRVLADESFLDEVMKIANTMANFSLPALISIKESINRTWESPLSEGIKFERNALYARFASTDAHEGMRAFVEKRKPIFKNC
jgi:enoyl-CoA hydratase